MPLEIRQLVVSSTLTPGGRSGEESAGEDRNRDLTVEAERRELREWFREQFRAVRDSGKER
ncbi:MAG: hypothetical protein EA421_09500 [Gemmatimonadales bacterium]|jgi:hypothetical protein|nr:MAG: hypothetical protein EA421_09500 [Gemmatimonadales bacterium]